MKKIITVLLIVSTLSMSIAQENILIPLDRPMEDLSLQDSSLKETQGITLKEGDDNILVDKTDKSEILFVQKEQNERVLNNYSMAVQTANITSIDKFLKSGSYSPNLEIYDGNTIVSIAGLRNNIDMLNSAIQYNANLNKINKNGDNFLHLATAYGKVDFFEGVKKLVGGEQWKSLLEQENNLGRNLLHDMLIYQNVNVDLLKLLTKNGLNVNKPDKNKQTPLHYAVILGQWDMLEEMLKTGGDMSLTDNDDQSVEDYLLKNIPIVNVHRFFQNLSPEGKSKIVKVIDKITFIKDENSLVISK